MKYQVLQTIPLKVAAFLKPKAIILPALLAESSLVLFPFPKGYLQSDCMEVTHQVRIKKCILLASTQVESTESPSSFPN